MCVSGVSWCYRMFCHTCASRVHLESKCRLEAELVQLTWFITKRQWTKGLRDGERQDQRRQSKQANKSNREQARVPKVQNRPWSRKSKAKVQKHWDNNGEGWNAWHTWHSDELARSEGETKTWKHRGVKANEGQVRLIINHKGGKNTDRKWSAWNKQRGKYF